MIINFFVLNFHKSTYLFIKFFAAYSNVRWYSRKYVDSFEYATSIQYNTDYRKVELETYDTSQNSEIDCSEESDRDDSSDKADDDISIDSSDDYDDVQEDKYLIFTTGFKTYTPHQIGRFNVIKLLKIILRC